MEQAIGELIAILVLAILINGSPVTKAPEPMKGRCYEVSTTVLGYVNMPSDDRPIDGRLCVRRKGSR